MRDLIYNALVAIPGINQVYQGESMLKAPKPIEFPVAVYRIGNETNANVGSGITAHNKFFQVYLHDVPADYTRIDTLIPLVRDAMTGLSNKGHILEVIWRENSRDLDDEFIGSVMRYLRFETAMAQ